MSFLDKYLGRGKSQNEPVLDEETEQAFGASDREHKPLEATNEDETDIQAVTFSDKEAKPTVKGFKKGAIYGAIGLVAFGSAVAMVMHNTDSTQAPVAKKQTTSSSVGGSGGTAVGPEQGFESYASMGQYNAEKQIEQKVNQANKVNAQGTQSVPQASGTNTVRQVPNRVNQSTYTASAPTTGVSTTATATPTSTHTTAMSHNPYASAIAFALGEAAPMGDGATAGSMTNTDDYGTYTSADRVLLTGTLVPVTLITGIDSSLDGQVTAQVRENVYDSIIGSSILIPAGSRLIGEYSSNDMSAGRISLVFTRIIFPDGNSVALSKALGVDGMGFGGVKDLYTEHSGKAVGAAFLTSLLAGIAGSSSDGSGSDNRSSGQEAISDAIANMLNTGQEIVKKRLDVEPTATIRPGFEFNVMLNTDIALEPYE